MKSNPLILRLFRSIDSNLIKSEAIKFIDYKKKLNNE